MPHCTECGADNPAHGKFCTNCGRALRGPDASAPTIGQARAPGGPRRTGRLFGWGGGAIAAVAVALFLFGIASQWRVVSSAGFTVAPELQQYQHAVAPVPEATAQALCPPAPDWTNVVTGPSGYRGRCVFIVGNIGIVTSGAGPVTFHLDMTADPPLPGAYERALQSLAGGNAQGALLEAVPARQSAGSAWVRLDPALDQQAFRSTVNQSLPIVVLGTIQGARDGLPYIVAQTYYYSPVVARLTPTPGDSGNTGTR